MSKISDLMREDNNSSSYHENYSIIFDYSIKTNINKNSNKSFSNKNLNEYNKLNKDLNNKLVPNNNIIYFKNKNKNKEDYKNNSEKNKNPKFISNNIKNEVNNNLKEQIEQLNAKINKLKDEKQTYKFLESNYTNMSKELEELKNEINSFKYILDEVSQEPNYINNSYKIKNSFINFNKTSFLNNKKPNNNISVKYNDNNQNKNIINEMKNINKIKSFNKNQINKGKKILKINKVQNVWNNQISLLPSFKGKSVKKKNNRNNNDNNNFNINLSINKTYMSNNSENNIDIYENDKSITILRQIQFIRKNSRKYFGEGLYPK